MDNNDKTQFDQFHKHAQEVVELDPLALDKECIRLPSDYLKFAYHSANAKMDVAKAKTELEKVEAEVSSDVRERPGKYGLEKVTEAAVKAAVITTDQYVEAQENYLKLVRDYDRTQAVVWALEHKKRCLTLLVDLHGTSYFASPKLSEEGTKVVQRMTQENVRRPRRSSED